MDENMKRKPETAKKYVGLVCTGNEEMTNLFDNWNRYGNPNRLDEININRLARLVGFINLHVTSHFAGYVHYVNDNGQYDEEVDKYHKGQGYADKGGWMAFRLLDPNDYSLDTFEKLIELTKTKYNYIINDTIKRFTRY